MTFVSSMLESRSLSLHEAAYSALLGGGEKVRCSSRVRTLPCFAKDFTTLQTFLVFLQSTET